MKTTNPQIYWQENHAAYDTFLQSSMNRIYFKTEDLWKFIRDFTKQLVEEEEVQFTPSVKEGIPEWLNLPTRRNAKELWDRTVSHVEVNKTLYKDRAIRLLIDRASLSDVVIDEYYAKELFDKHCVL